MKLKGVKKNVPKKIFALLEKKGFEELRPSQVKSINEGLFEDKNLLVCTPTASGKTLVAELGALNGILYEKGKALYVVPLRALASEKYKQFKKNYQEVKVGISSGEIDRNENHLSKYDLIVLTSEKLDSLLRHHTPWIKEVKTVIFDEIHLMNDPSRGPTLEIVITIIRRMLKDVQIIGLSATIGNPEEFAEWLNARLVQDDWRPITLHKGVMIDDTIHYKT